MQPRSTCSSNPRLETLPLGRYAEQTSLPRSSAPSQADQVTQAWDRCRQTRRKCDSNVPKCAPCESQGNECSYANTRRNRGRPSGYTWALEIIIAHLLKEDAAVNNVIGQFLKRYMDPLQGTGATAYNDHRVQQLHVAWKESRILAQVNQFLTSENSSPNIDCVMHGTSSLQGGGLL